MPSTVEPQRARRPVPARFLASRGVLRLDAFMTRAIKVCGFAIIIAVFGIFLFIFSQVLPLFRGAKVNSVTETGPLADAARVRFIGLDESAKTVFLYEGGDEVRFIGLDKDNTGSAAKLGIAQGTTITATTYDAGARRVAFGTSDGKVGLAEISGASLKTNEPIAIGQTGAPVETIAYGDSGKAKLFAAVQNQNGTAKLLAVPLVQKKTLLGTGKLERGAESDLTPQVTGRPVRLLVSANADSVISAEDDGTVHYFYFDNGAAVKRQVFRPFADLADAKIASMDFLFGDVSLVFTNAAGACRVFSLYIPQGSDTRLFGETKRFTNLPSGAHFFCASQRNKSFLIGTGNFASLRHATTETVRWEQRLPFEISAAAVDGKFKRAVLLGNDGRLRSFDIEDPHPEAGAKAFFGKVWYEGATAPKYEWQSTGGSDEFEPKLSLMPLIFGTLKGTLWAMVFAVPVECISS